SAVCGASSQAVTISPKAASAVYGTCQPPAVNPPERSSSAAPGACITPSSVRKVFTVSLIIDPLVQVMRPSLGRRDRAGLVRERQRASARRRELAGEQAPTRR